MKTVINKVVTSEGDIEIVEKFIPPPEHIAGTTAIKDVRIKNLKNDCFVRVKILVSDSDIDKNIKLNYDTTGNWKEYDGYWYYTLPLKTGETTVPVLNSVTFIETLNEGINKNTEFEIICYAESVQSETFDKGENNYLSAFCK